MATQGVPDAPATNEVQHPSFKLRLRAPTTSRNPANMPATGSPERALQPVNDMCKKRANEIGLDATLETFKGKRMKAEKSDDLQATRIKVEYVEDAMEHVVMEGKPYKYTIRAGDADEIVKHNLVDKKAYALQYLPVRLQGQIRLTENVLEKLLENRRRGTSVKSELDHNFPIDPETIIPAPGHRRVKTALEVAAEETPDWFERRRPAHQYLEEERESIRSVLEANNVVIVQSSFLIGVLHNMEFKYGVSVRDIMKHIVDRAETSTKDLDADRSPLHRSPSPLDLKASKVGIDAALKPLHDQWCGSIGDVFDGAGKSHVRVSLSKRWHFEEEVLKKMELDGAAEWISLLGAELEMEARRRRDGGVSFLSLDGAKETLRALEGVERD